jgi:ketosteroid isomerase-like protein
MATAENKAIVHTFFAAGNEGDLTRALALLADDVTWTNIGTTRFSGTYEGKQAVVDDLLGSVFGRLQGGIRSTIDNVVAEGEFVVVQSRGRATTRNGDAYDNTYCHVFRIRNGRIVAVTEYLDTELATRVLGTVGP